MMVGPLAAGGLVDEGGEIFVPLYEVSMYAGTGDDDPPADPPIFAAEVSDRLEHGCTFNG